MDSMQTQALEEARRWKEAYREVALLYIDPGFLDWNHADEIKKFIDDEAKKIFEAVR